MKYLDLIVSILSGLAVCIPLAVKLTEYVIKATREKNWGRLLSLVTQCMSEAEKKYSTGSQRREWVLSGVEAAADELDYDVDLEVVGKMIDRLCDMSKVVNGSKLPVKQ